MAPDARATDHLREAVILAACVCCPEVVEKFESGLEGMSCTDQRHAELRNLILLHGSAGAEVLRKMIESALGSHALENLLGQSHVAITPCVRNPGNPEITAMTIAEELAKLEATRGLHAEIADAAEDLSGVADEGVTWRLSEAAQAADRAQRSGQEDTAEYDLAENGARISRDERSALDSLMGRIRYEKPKGRH